MRTEVGVILEGLRADSSVSHRSTEMDVTMIGLQNAGKTSLLRVLAVCGPDLGTQRFEELTACIGW